MGNGHASAPISSTILESDLGTKSTFRVNRRTKLENELPACTASGETRSRPSGPKMEWRALVSFAFAAATSAFAASSGEAKRCSPSPAQAEKGGIEQTRKPQQNQAKAGAEF